MSRMRQQLRETGTLRLVGFNDAVSDLGTHRIHGMDVPYSRCMVYNTIKGVFTSRRLLERIVERRPDLLDLTIASEDVCRAARELGWLPAEERRAARLAGKGAA